MTIAAERPDTHDVTPAADVRVRSLVTVRGRIQYIEVSPHDRPAQLTVRLADRSGAIDCIFMGRRFIVGLEPGAGLCVHGRVAAGQDMPVLFNPRYELCQVEG